MEVQRGNPAAAPQAAVAHASPAGGSEGGSSGADAARQPRVMASRLDQTLWGRGGSAGCKRVREASAPVEGSLDGGAGLSTRRTRQSTEAVPAARGGPTPGAALGSIRGPTGTSALVPTSSDPCSGLGSGLGPGAGQAAATNSHSTQLSDSGSEWRLDSGWRSSSETESSANEPSTSSASAISASSASSGGGVMAALDDPAGKVAHASSKGEGLAAAAAEVPSAALYPLSLKSKSLSCHMAAMQHAFPVELSALRSSPTSQPVRLYGRLPDGSIRLYDSARLTQYGAASSNINITFYGALLADVAGGEERVGSTPCRLAVVEDGRAVVEAGEATEPEPSTLPSSALRGGGGISVPSETLVELLGLSAEHLAGLKGRLQLQVRDSVSGTPGVEELAGVYLASRYVRASSATSAGSCPEAELSPAAAAVGERSPAGAPGAEPGDSGRGEERVASTPFRLAVLEDGRAVVEAGEATEPEPRVLQASAFGQGSSIAVPAEVVPQLLGLTGEQLADLKSRLQLQGHSGLRATAGIAAGSAVCVVGGYVLPRGAAEELVASGLSHCRPEVRAQVAAALEGSGTGGGSAASLQVAWRLMASSLMLPYGLQLGLAEWRGMEEAANGDTSGPQRPSQLVYGGVGALREAAGGIG
ncbi:hypothetical protein HYH03_019028 [Edaphochlamys debaryana]|uniref:Uncharacterized protein n=1 Tax=Edaphochlamys debaryana TaxID=47281 RepID=A0A836BMK2_9CHLO|nr:hypothetical protein HYH03_019028 [Edaphochlamys debaryana]|eukprot:KAG2482020.1 hypothetical protein HYH03_019028 [Edaphochlamys debaryana]